MKIKTFEEMKKYKMVKVTKLSNLNHASFDNFKFGDIETFGVVTDYPCKPGFSQHNSSGGTVFYVGITDKTHSKRRYCVNGCGHYFQGNDKEGHFGNPTCTRSATCRKTLSNGKPDPDSPGCGKTWYAEHNIVNGYEGTHYSEKGHKAYRQCSICGGQTEYTGYKTDYKWNGAYGSGHVDGKGHRKHGNCQLNKTGGTLCNQLDVIPGEYYESWGATKWFPYDDTYCIQGRKCTANNCSFPSNGGNYNEEGYDDTGGTKSRHDMDANKVCKRCGWSDRPPQWEWTTSELNAFRGVSGYDVTDLTYTRWNKFVEHVTMVVNWYYGSGSKPSLSGASMSSSDKVLTASRFNTVRSAIGGMESTGIGNVYPGDTVYGSYFITLRNSLNNVRK